MVGLNAFMTRIAEVSVTRDRGHWLRVEVNEGPADAAVLNDFYGSARALVEHLVAEANAALPPDAARFEVHDLPARWSPEPPSELGFVIARGESSVSWHLRIERDAAQLRVRGLPSGDEYRAASLGGLQEMESVLVAMLESGIQELARDR